MMHPELATYLDALTSETSQPAGEVMRLAVAVGLRQLWRTHTLGRYIGGELTKEQIAKTLGAEWVDIAEVRHMELRSDLVWALELDDALEDDEDEDAPFESSIERNLP